MVQAPRSRARRSGGPDVWPRRWALRAAGVVLASAGLARLVRAHRSAQAADGALTAEDVARLRRCPPGVIQGARAHLAVERRAGAVELSLCAHGRAATALVDPASLPIADRRADTVRAHGILDSTFTQTPSSASCIACHASEAVLKWTSAMLRQHARR